MADQTLAKYVNERSILTLLRAKGSASRAEISRSLGLTAATIGRLTSDMMKRKLLREVSSSSEPAAEREPGRPGIAMEVNPGGGYCLGVEIGVSVVRIALIDLSVALIETTEFHLQYKPSADEAVEAVRQAIANFSKKAAYCGKLIGVGVTVPGLVTTGGFIVNLPILGWKSTDFRSRLAKVTNLPVAIENNANAAAFGAVYSRPGLVAPFTIFLKLGTGCGGAAVVDGRLIRGADGTGLELGHINVGEDGAVCSCGRKGCLETWVNLAALGRIWFAREPDSSAGLSNLPAVVAEAYEKGSARAIAAVNSLATHLSSGLVSLINIFNPAQVVLGGTMMPILSLIRPTLASNVASRIIPGTNVPEIILSPLGAFECAIGAACISHHLSFDISNVDVRTNFINKDSGGPA